MKLALITARYAGMKYAEIGCLELSYRVLRDMGKNPPDALGAWGVANYRELADASIRRAQRVMLATFWQLGAGVSVREMTIGDLVVVMHRGPIVFPAVYVGRGMAIASFIRQGVRTFRLDNLNYPVMARRFD